MSSPVRIGTRGSKLAMVQALLVESRIKKMFPDVKIEIIKIKTKGDAVQQGAISSIGRGIFTREIEEALLRREIDLAVHSAKDLETELPKGLIIGAVLEREDARDCLITLDRRKFNDLPREAKIGTSSLRRKAQLLHVRPDLNVVDLRGNVDTRLKKLESGEFEGIVMAAAGIKRLGLSALITEILDETKMLPQAAQGAIALEIRSDDSNMQAMMKTINHEKSFLQTEAERAFLRTLHGGCQIPVGIKSDLNEKNFHIKAAVFSLDGKKAVRNELSGPKEKAKELGVQLAEKLLLQGAREILEEIRKGTVLKGTGL